MAVHLIVGKMKDPAWTSFVLQETESNTVVGGAVVREHTSEGRKGIAELFLISIKSGCQQNGLGRRLIWHLKEAYSSIVAFADLRALEFFKRQGFLEVGTMTKQYSDLLRVIERCDKSILMAYKLPNFTVTAQIHIIDRPSRNSERDKLKIKMKNFDFQVGQRSRLDQNIAEFRKLVDTYEVEFRAHRI